MTNLSSTQLMQTYLEQVVGQGRLELIDALFCDDVIDEAAMAFGAPAGRAAVVAHVKGFRKHLDTPTVTIEQIVGQQDRVMAHWTFSGTHNGPWLNQPATGKPITGTVFSFFTLTQGRVSRYRLWLHANFDKPLVFDSRHSQPPSP